MWKYNILFLKHRQKGLYEPPIVRRGEIFFSRLDSGLRSGSDSSYSGLKNGVLALKKKKVVLLLESLL